MRSVLVVFACVTFSAFAAEAEDDNDDGCCYGIMSKCDVEYEAKCLKHSVSGNSDFGCEWRSGPDADCSAATTSAASLMLDGQGNIIYDLAGYVVLQEYAEMCGGKNADEECYECFECSSGGNRCVPIEDCIPSCDDDDDCTREQICLSDEKICQLPDGPPKDDEDYRGGAGNGSKRKGGKGNRGPGVEVSVLSVVSAHDEARDVGCCLAKDVTARDASKCNLAYKSVYCDTHSGWDNCEWVNDEAHQVQNDCDITQSADVGLVPWTAHFDFLGHSPSSQLDLLQGAIVFAVAAAVLCQLYRYYARKAKDEYEKIRDRRMDADVSKV